MTDVQGMVVPEWTLGDRLRKARELTGLRQGPFADELGIARNSVVRYEAGAAVPRRPVLASWALRCGVSIDWLVSDGGDAASAAKNRCFSQTA